MWSIEARGAIHRQALTEQAERYRLERAARDARRAQTAAAQTVPARLRLPAWLRLGSPPRRPNQAHDAV